MFHASNVSLTANVIFEKACRQWLVRLLPLLVVSSVVQAGSVGDINQADPKAWIHLMNEQVKQVELDGYFTYERGSHSSSYHYIRQVVDGDERQRLIFMDGEEQELVNEAGFLRCLHAKGRQSHNIRTAEIKSIFNVRKDFTHVWEYYDGEFLSDSRVAGRPVKVIKLQPKDDDRFPYIFAIDSEKAVLLKMMVITHSNKVLERFRYVSINFDDVSDADFHRGIEDYTSVAIDLHQGEQYSPSKAQELSSVVLPLDVEVMLEWLPAGFVEKTKADVLASAASRTFSDGLSSFSLFVEPLDDSLGDVDAKSRSISTVNGGTAISARYLQSKKGAFQMTVIGELPLDTVNEISSKLLIK